MDFLRNLFRKTQPPAGISITLQVKDEAMAKQLIADQYFLMGVLLGDGSSASKKFQEALGKGGSLSHKVSRNSTEGGYNVELTVTPSGAASGKNEDVTSLISQLNHDDVEVRGRAADSLGRLADPRAIDPLYQLMRAESQRILQATVSLYGGSQADHDRADKLIKAQVRRTAADALKRIGSPAIPTLVEALQVTDDRFLMVRGEAARVLGEMKVTQAVRPLIDMLTQSETTNDTKKTAAQALESIGGPEAEQAVRHWRSRNENQGAG